MPTSERSRGLIAPTECRGPPQCRAAPREDCRRIVAKSRRLNITFRNVDNWFGDRATLLIECLSLVSHLGDLGFRLLEKPVHHSSTMTAPRKSGSPAGIRAVRRGPWFSSSRPQCGERGRCPGWCRSPIHSVIIHRGNTEPPKLTTQLENSLAASRFYPRHIAPHTTPGCR